MLAGYQLTIQANANATLTKVSTYYNMNCYIFSKGGEMSGEITGVRIRKDRAEMLKEKAMELTVKQKEYIKEADIINFLIDKFTDRINIDREGLFVEDEKEN